MANEMDARLISQAEQVTSAEGTALVPISTEAGQPQKNISLADMAGSMGAQASEVADIKTLWGQTSDGQMVQINKASIASVLGNLLYGADTKEELASVVAERIGYATASKNGLLASEEYRRGLQSFTLSEGQSCTLTKFNAGLQSVRIFGVNVDGGGFVDLYVRTDIGGVGSVINVHGNESIKVEVNSQTQVVITVLSGIFNLRLQCGGGFYPNITIK